MLNDAQYAKLLEPLNPNRVAKRSNGSGKQLSYVESWDVKAHLTRIFGFGGWSWVVNQYSFIYETSTPILDDNGKPRTNKKGEELVQWDVAYSALGTLTIHSLNVQFAEAAAGQSYSQMRGEAHDNAIKNAESDAIKRAAINLGDQFGLSLYRNGSTAAVVRITLDKSDTVSHNGEPEPPVTDTSDAVPDSPGADAWIASMKECVEAKDVTALLNIKKGMVADGVAEHTYQGVTLAKWLDKAIAQVGKK